MTVVSNDPSWWPYISVQIFNSYWMVAACVVVVYDWVLTLGQEIELIWIRYIGISFSVANVLVNMPSVSLTDVGCNIAYYAVNGTNVVVNAMLGVIMTVRLHAMYQGSRMMLIFLVIIFLVVNIACGVISAIALKTDLIGQTPEEFILSGTYMCGFEYEGDEQLLISMLWMLNTIWEALALCLSVWVAVKHFRDLRRLGPSTRSAIGECLRVLIQSHVLYFASFAGVSCLQLMFLSSEILNSNSIEVQVAYGVFQILLFVQMFVLGPRLILSVRENHAKLVAGFDAEASMNSIVFQERVHVLTNSVL
ncbi:uncharacterized protein F5147DRAFT_653421 [Suillus discolor]|uniref:DUF6533 domain-containing protein n=1 Tax=Suillus discolor TaxID=1912936 RepID=A0A9P7F5Z0_9AGAM|nr:uncharacterized protein F5147DRAFT_653421 [Suillus discolor]KAG2107188.1 hypothetical protein F5147DRAFT_653421 [Suillus discolor]